MVVSRPLRQARLRLEPRSGLRALNVAAITSLTVGVTAVRTSEVPEPILIMV